MAVLTTCQLERRFCGRSVSGEGKASGRAIIIPLAEIPCRNIIISITINVFTINKDTFLPSSVHSFVSTYKQYFLCYFEFGGQSKIPPGTEAP